MTIYTHIHLNFAFYNWLYFQSLHVIPVLLIGEPSVFAQTRVGVGSPVASHRSRTLLPREDVILVAEVMTVGFTQLSSSARWKSTPARFSGPLQVRNRSIKTTGVSAILESSISLEILQSQNQGLSWTPEDKKIGYIKVIDWLIVSYHYLLIDCSNVTVKWQDKWLTDI